MREGSKYSNFVGNPDPNLNSGSSPNCHMNTTQMYKTDSDFFFCCKASVYKHSFKFYFGSDQILILIYLNATFEIDIVDS